jgi:hypothetical protein
MVVECIRYVIGEEQSAAFEQTEKKHYGSASIAIVPDSQMT